MNFYVLARAGLPSSTRTSMCGQKFAPRSCMIVGASSQMVELSSEIFKPWWRAILPPGLQTGSLTRSNSLSAILVCRLGYFVLFEHCFIQLFLHFQRHILPPKFCDWRPENFEFFFNSKQGVLNIKGEPFEDSQVVLDSHNFCLYSKIFRPCLLMNWWKECHS